MRRRHFIGVSAAAAVAGYSVMPFAARAQGKDKNPTRTVLIVGDSLSAEYGLARGEGWVALLEKRMNEQTPGWKVVNASISGDTTAGGRARLPELLRQHQPDVVVIELGGNDALRGLPLTGTKNNLQAMVQSAKAAKAKAILLGMRVPPNYGRRYGEELAAIYPQVARAEKVEVLPFFLAGIAEGPNATAQFQTDRIHPLAKAHPRMLDNVWPLLKPLLK